MRNCGTHTEFMAHLCRTKHQGQYHQFELQSLEPEELVMIIDYKMKLELGAQKRKETGMGREGSHCMVVLWWPKQVNLRNAWRFWTSGAKI